MAQQNLDRTKVAGRPIDDQCLRPTQRMGAIFASHQTNPRHPFIDEPGILAGAEMPIRIDPARKDIVVDRATPAARAKPAGSLERPGVYRTEQGDLFSAASRLLVSGSVRR